VDLEEKHLGHELCSENVQEASMVWVDGFPGVGVAFYLLNCDFFHVAMDFC
jgi:hypothetical protein